MGLNPSPLLSQHSRHLLRWLLSLGAPEPSVKAGEQMAALTLYPSEDRDVRAVPTRRPVKRKAS